MKSLQYILYTCLLSILFSMAVFAADGQLSFSDPSGKVGEEITVNMKVKSDSSLARVDILLAERIRMEEPGLLGFMVQVIIL